MASTGKNWEWSQTENSISAEDSNPGLIFSHRFHPSRGWKFPHAPRLPSRRGWPKQQRIRKNEGGWCGGSTYLQHPLPSDSPVAPPAACERPSTTSWIFLLPWLVPGGTTAARACAKERITVAWGLKGRPSQWCAAAPPWCSRFWSGCNSVCSAGLCPSMLLVVGGCLSISPCARKHAAVSWFSATD